MIFFPLIMSMSFEIVILMDVLIQLFLEKLFYCSVPALMILNVFLPAFPRQSMRHRHQGCDVGAHSGAGLHKFL